METVNTLSDYSQLSKLFLYPQDEGYKTEMLKVEHYLMQTNAEAALALKPFIDYMERSSIVEMQELFLRSFDLQAITTLDIGFILFGEDYKRGKLLVHLNEEHNKAGNDCETELSDHLPNLLRLLSKMTNDEMRLEIATFLIIPAVEKMISEFSIGKIEKKDVVYKKHQKVLLEYSTNYRTVYQNCLQALFLVLKRDFGYTPASVQPITAGAGYSDPNNPASISNRETDLKDFSQNIETEMITEK